MDIDDIRKLLAQLTSLMSDNKLSELEVEQDGLRIHLKKEGQAASAVPAAVAPASHVIAAPTAAADTGQNPSADTQTGLITISSPMVGTFYRAPSPDAEAFVEVGDTVNDESVVCIIEAMKVFNDIRAECEGKVVDILVGNGEAVEYGQALFLIEPPR